MDKKRHTKDTIITTLQNVSRRLKKTSLSKREVQQVLPESSVNYHFGSIGNALEAAGLERTDPTKHLQKYRTTYSDDDLCRSILLVEETLGHEPRHNEYLAHGEYSVKPFRKRFGVWRDTLAHYRKWKAEQGSAGHGASNQVHDVQEREENVAGSQTKSGGSTHPVIRSVPTQLYGEPIDFRGLRHAPINEQGVVYLFGMVSRELGFYVEAIQQGFPDCEGKYLHDQKRNLWGKARIEFEFKASAFRQHAHDANQCDFIVCWENDWPDCPISVIELKQEILKLPST